MDLGKLPDLVSAAELTDCYRRCVALKEAMAGRQAGGGQRSGRYMKHDSARRRCLEKVVLPALKRGVLPSVTDTHMLFEMAGPRDISGPDKQMMDKWSNIFARDPRQTDARNESTIEAYTNLLVWVKDQPRLYAFVSRAPRRGRPWALHTTYKLVRGGQQVAGKTLDQVKLDAPWYIAWACSMMKHAQPYQWSFPRDEFLYLGLLEMEANKTILKWEESGASCTGHIKLPQSAKDCFERCTLGTRAQRAAAYRAHTERDFRETVDDADADAPDPFKPLDSMDRTANTVGGATVKFFREITNEVKDGVRPSFEKWPDFMVRPPHWTISEPFDVAAMETLPICFWSPFFWRRLGVDRCPCERHGWSHASCVSVCGFREPRLVKDGNGNHFGLSSARTYCSECASERKAAKQALELARAQRVPADDLLRLEKRVKEITCWASTISPKTMAFLSEKFPWIALVVPCVARVRADPRALRE